MKSLNVGTYHVSPVHNTSTVDVFNSSLNTKKYSFTLADNSYVNSAIKNEEDGIVWFITQADNILVYKIGDIEATHLKTIDFPSTYVSDTRAFVLDKDGSCWIGVYDNTILDVDKAGNRRYRALYKMSYDSATESVADPSIIETWSHQELGWNNGDTTMQMTYSKEKHSLVIQFDNYTTSTTEVAPEYRRYQEDLVSFVIYDITTSKHRPISVLEPMGVGRTWYSTRYPGFRNTLGNGGYSQTINGAVHSEFRGISYFLIKYSGSYGHMQSTKLVGVDVHSGRIRFIKAITTDMTTDNDGRYLQLEYSETEDVLYIIGLKRIVGYDSKWSKVLDREFNSVARHDRTFDTVTKRFVIGHNSGMKLIGSDDQTIDSTVDDYGYHGNVMTLTHDSDRKSNDLVKPCRVHSATITNDTTPQITLTVGESVIDGVSQNFEVLLNGTIYKSSLGDWEYSEDETTWSSFEGIGLSEGGTHGTDGVICDSTRPVLYVRFTATVELPANAKYEMKITTNVDRV